MRLAESLPGDFRRKPSFIDRRGVAALPLCRLPDARAHMLVAQGADLVAVRTAGGNFSIIKKGGDSFAVREWLAADADPRTPGDPTLAQGQAAVNIANDIMAEAQQLAADLRANGNKISERLKEFARLTEKVSTAMRNTRAEVLNSEDPLPPTTVLPPINGETIQ
jgi:hypothetical protein